MAPILTQPIHPQFFWTTNGGVYSFPLLDNQGNFQLFATKAYIADQNLIATHDVDSTPANRPHVHFKDDFAAGNNSLTFAKNYWDKRFGASDAIPKTSSNGNATTKTNCFAYALVSYIFKGTYNYWIDTNGNNSVNAAFTADTQNFALNQVKSSDALYYWRNSQPFHATGVVEVSVDESGKSNPTKLAWKWNASPIYIYTTTGYGTPIYSGNDPAVGAKPMGWEWTTSGAGAQGDLNLADNVRRRKN